MLCVRGRGVEERRREIKYRRRDLKTLRNSFRTLVIQYTLPYVLDKVRVFAFAQPEP